MSVTASSTVIPPELKTTRKSIGDAPLEVIIKRTYGSPGDDCIMVVCEYPTGVEKHHQIFLGGSADAILPIMVQTFRTLFDIGVVPLNAVPTAFTDAVSHTVSFKLGD